MNAQALHGSVAVNPSDASGRISRDALEAESLYRFFRAGNEETLALRGVSLGVAAGEMVAVVGPSGSGKSTLLSLLAGLDEPDGGAVFVHGQRLSHQSEQARARLRGRMIGVLLQAGNLLPHLTVTGNIEIAQRLSDHAVRRDIAELLAGLSLRSRAAAYPGELSGGELARAGLAVALANNPVVLLADEPTGELDAHTESQVLELLTDLSGTGVAILVASHSPAVAAAADRVITLSDGEVVR
ncbi:ABC transporter ATP-binding protein [Nakamurella antarctica]|uniref:ABC transporter ATP-binding protein n=1 Tax=Nakamurella antarctica TaxID=1902245 RepID=A0A3G8ZNC3_9ACTN|nr:ABC transporter ATP-binding protein [Nakamurella antarctica]AZI58799.1 ABC transporter ATP-binding protein [Nakamurella antarctica]